MKNNGQAQREGGGPPFLRADCGYGTAAAEGQPAVLYRFLDEREQRLAAIELRRQHFPQDQVCFWAGFDVPQEAPARRMLGLFPDYLALSEGMDRAILEEQFPIQRVALFFPRRMQSPIATFWAP